MNVHYLQHVPFEDLGSIEPYLVEHGHQVSRTRLFMPETLPEVESFDWLIVMGGPMGVYDTAEFAWLDAEKTFIRAAINQNKIVLGICLGAQLIADVLGAPVRKNAHREIGWHQIKRDTTASPCRLRTLLPREVEVFHWHGDTFELPDGSERLASSVACANQGFVWHNRVIGFQFHLETTPTSAAALIEHCGEELDGSQYVQGADQILADPARFTAINNLMHTILRYCENLPRG